jgi:hypothetical protein
MRNTGYSWSTLPVILLLVLAIAAIGSASSLASAEPYSSSEECGLPSTDDTKGWKKVFGGGIAFLLPPAFERDPAREESFIHGGRAWRQGERWVEALQGKWGAGSFQLVARCVIELDWMRTVLPTVVPLRACSGVTTPPPSSWRAPGHDRPPAGH